MVVSSFLSSLLPSSITNTATAAAPPPPSSARLLPPCQPEEASALLPPIPINRMGPDVECERWLAHQIDILQMRQSLVQQHAITMPAKLERRMLQFEPTERNMRGETLIISVIKYVTDRQAQIRYINLLVRSGCDISVADTRTGRTPLMYACLAQNEEITALIIHYKADMTVADRLGNTALMYAALYGNTTLVSLLVDQLVRTWSFDVFRAKNVMGHTAEALARRNARFECSRLLRKERIQMLQRMHKQLSLIHLSASVKGWTGYNTVYKAANRFSHKLQNRQRENTNALEPAQNINKLPTLGSAPSSGALLQARPVIRKTEPSLERQIRLSHSVGEGDFAQLMKGLPAIPLGHAISAFRVPASSSPLGQKLSASAELPALSAVASTP